MLLSLIVFAIVAYTVLRWLKGVLPDPDRAPQPPAQPRLAPTRILACSHCGTHIPAPEAQMLADGRIACCDAHRRALDA